MWVLNHFSSVNLFDSLAVHQLKQSSHDKQLGFITLLVNSYYSKSGA